MCTSTPRSGKYWQIANTPGNYATYQVIDVRGENGLIRLPCEYLGEKGGGTEHPRKRRSGYNYKMAKMLRF